MQPFYVFTLGSTFATAFEYSFVCLFPFHGIGNIQVSKRDLGTPQVISNFNVSQFIMIEKSLIITVSLGPTLAHFGLLTFARSAISSFGGLEKFYLHHSIKNLDK